MHPLMAAPRISTQPKLDLASLDMGGGVHLAALTLSGPMQLSIYMQANLAQAAAQDRGGAQAQALQLLASMQRPPVPMVAVADPRRDLQK